MKEFLTRNKWLLLASILLIAAAYLSYSNYSLKLASEKELNRRISTLKTELDSAKKNIEAARRQIKREVSAIENDTRAEIQSYSTDDIARELNSMLKKYRSRQ